MQRLLPSLREKKRYIVYETITEKPIQRHNNPVISQLNETLGLFESAQAGIQDIDSNSKRGIIRVENHMADKVKLALTFIKKINDQDVIVRSITTTGLLSKAKSELNA